MSNQESLTILSKLRKKRKSNETHKNPTVSLWLGYVEDEETTEMIMKKFEKLEEYEKKIINSDNLIHEPDINIIENRIIDEMEESHLDEHQLEKLFHETSSFSIDNLNNSDSNRITISDEENEYLNEIEKISDEEYSENSQFKKKKKKKKEKTFKPKIVDPFKSNEITEFKHPIKKKVRLIDPLIPIFIRLPNLPIPRSWAKTVKPYVDIKDIPIPINSIYIELESHLEFDITSFGTMKFQAILVDPPWNLSEEITSLQNNNLILPEELTYLHLDKLIDTGLLFIWVEKELIHRVIKTLAKKKFIYIENLVWIKQTPANQQIFESYTYFKKSKYSLLIFKKGTGRIELRHQRNCDVIFDFVSEYKPEFVYDTIETLLPTSIFNSDIHSDIGFQLLELWAHKNHKRENWVMVHFDTKN
jgi:N6-adenosine-specific RNA methylase IME4